MNVIKVEKKHKSILKYFYTRVIINGFIPMNGVSSSGVYVIDHIYIGESGDIKNRIKYHIQTAINGTHKNKELSEYILNMFLNDKIMYINTIDRCRGNEGYHIKNYRENGFYLFNKSIGRGGE